MPKYLIQISAAWRLPCSLSGFPTEGARTIFFRWLVPCLVPLAGSPQAFAGGGKDLPFLKRMVARSCETMDGRFQIRCKQAGIDYLNRFPVPCKRGAYRAYRIGLIQSICASTDLGEAGASESRIRCFEDATTRPRTSLMGAAVGNPEVLADVPLVYSCDDPCAVYVPPYKMGRKYHDGGNRIYYRDLNGNERWGADYGFREVLYCEETRLDDAKRRTELAIATAIASSGVDSQLNGTPDILKCEPKSSASATPSAATPKAKILDSRPSRPAPRLAAGTAAGASP